jgi:hypothetical protein
VRSGTERSGRSIASGPASSQRSMRTVFGLTECAGGGQDWTQWLSSVASGPASGPTSGCCFSPFFFPIFDATSPNQVSIQRDPNKHQLEPDMSDLSQTLKFFKIFCLRLVFFLRKYAINTRGATYGHAIEFMNPWERQMLSLSMDEHRDYSKPNRKETTKQQPCI